MGSDTGSEGSSKIVYDKAELYGRFSELSDKVNVSLEKLSESDLDDLELRMFFEARHLKRDAMDILKKKDYERAIMRLNAVLDYTQYVTKRLDERAEFLHEANTFYEIESHKLGDECLGENAPIEKKDKQTLTIKTHLTILYALITEKDCCAITEYMAEIKKLSYAPKELAENRLEIAKRHIEEANEIYEDLIRDSFAAKNAQKQFTDVYSQAEAHFKLKHYRKAKSLAIDAEILAAHCINNYCKEQYRILEENFKHKLACASQHRRTDNIMRLAKRADTLSGANYYKPAVEILQVLGTAITHAYADYNVLAK